MPGQQKINYTASKCRSDFQSHITHLLLRGGGGREGGMREASSERWPSEPRVTVTDGPALCSHSWRKLEWDHSRYWPIWIPSRVHPLYPITFPSCRWASWFKLLSRRKQNTSFFPVLFLSLPLWGIKSSFWVFLHLVTWGKIHFSWCFRLFFHRVQKRQRQLLLRASSSNLPWCHLC